MGVHKKKILTYLFFLHRINVRKRVKISPHLCEHRIDKIFSQKISQNSSQNCRFLRKIHRVIVFCEEIYWLTNDTHFFRA